MKFLFLTLALFVHVAIGSRSSVVPEHGTMELRCNAKNRKLHIVSASYGKGEKCHATGSRNKVRQLCQRKQSCSVKAENNVFTDPCIGTFKELRVKYRCPKVAVVDEHKTLQLKCRKGATISIFRASYGKQEKNCHAVKSRRVVRRECQGKESCSVLAKNNVFGDPCVGTFKELEVIYWCPKQNSRNSKKVPEHGQMELNCAKGVINILDASYGKEDKDCHEPDSTRIVEDRCESKQSCSVLAKNSVFGDPCVGTFKELVVSYNCVPQMSVPEHGTLELNCKTGVLNIIKASYGKQERLCHADSSDGKVGKACDGRKSCSVKAENKIFGDPCVGVFKELKVTYECTD